MKPPFWTKLFASGLRTPVYHQVHATECGSACLGMVLAHHGCWVSMDELRTLCEVGRDGCSAADLKRGAEHFGFDVTGWRKEPWQLRAIKLPAILFWEFNHFVVLEGFRGDRYLLNDPTNGHVSVTEEQFSARFTGIVLECSPSANFEKRGTRPSVLRKLRPWYQQHRFGLLLSVLCGLILMVPSIGLPLLLGAFVDQVLTARHALGHLLPIAACGLLLLNLVFVWLQQRTLRGLSLAVSVEQSERFLSKLLKLPVDYFNSRFSGDLAQRAQRIDAIAANASVQLTRTVIELGTSSVLLIAMLMLEPVIALGVVLVTGLGLTGHFLVSRLRSDAGHQMRREQGQLAGLMNFATRNLRLIRASGQESDAFANWTGFQSRELAARQSFVELGLVASGTSTLMVLMVAAVVLGLGGPRVLWGQMSLGELVAFYFFATHFIVPVGNFFQSFDTIRILEADLNRVDDVLDAEEDKALKIHIPQQTKGPATIDGRLRLAGHLELRDLTFGYRGHNGPLIQNFNLRIKPGQRVAIIGPSGAGKSTLALLIAGVYQPWQGRVLFDGHEREEIPRSIMSESVAFVDQQVSLFSGTIRDNLTMWNPSVQDGMITRAAIDAAIHDDIARRRLNYSGYVEEGGSNFSGGQRQRLEIARALVSRPSLIVLDEATSSLDAGLESQIDDALRRRGCACVIIAHRLSTIRDCDEIIVLDKGITVQRGSHDELMRQQGGLYRELVMKQ